MSGSLYACNIRLSRLECVCMCVCMRVCVCVRIMVGTNVCVLYNCFLHAWLLILNRFLVITQLALISCKAFNHSTQLFETFQVKYVMYGYIGYI